MNMSSDSDSDVCDFSSDINKHMSKGQYKFWTHYKSKDASIMVPGNKIDGCNQDESTLTNIIEISDAECGSSELQMLNVEPSNSDESVAQNLKVGTRGTVTEKLNKLSETIKDILDDGRNTRKKTNTRRKAKRNSCASTSRTRRKTRLNIRQTVVNIGSSDDEVAVTITCNLDKTVELNPIVTVKVLWKSIEYKLFKVRKFQSLDCIYHYYVNEVKVNPRLLFFTIDDRQITLKDNSYISLRLNDNRFIEGGILPDSYLNNSVPHHNFEEKDMLKFKIQYNARRYNEFIVSCKKTDKIEFILWQVIRAVKQPVEHIKLYLDGKMVKADNLIGDLDLEDGDCFDLQVD